MAPKPDPQIKELQKKVSRLQFDMKHVEKAVKTLENSLVKELEKMHKNLGANIKTEIKNQHLLDRRDVLMEMRKEMKPVKEELKKLKR